MVSLEEEKAKKICNVLANEPWAKVNECIQWLLKAIKESEEKKKDAV